MDKNKKIAVVFGGPSSEAEVSAKTSDAVYRALKARDFNVHKLEFSENIATDLKNNSIDIVFNAMHGLYGEDGSLQGLLEVVKIPYTHSGVIASAMAMNKQITKQIASNKGVNIASGKVLKGNNINAQNIKIPCVIKPIADGSSVGVMIIKTEEELRAVHLSDKEYLVEDYISGRELSVAVLDGKALGAIEIKPKSGVYDYESKYTAGASEYICPPDIPEDIYITSIKYAEIVHSELNCKGVTRSDIIYDEENEKLYFLEINTHPGMTENSLVPKIAAEKGIDFETLVEKVLASASLELS